MICQIGHVIFTIIQGFCFQQMIAMMRRAKRALRRREKWCPQFDLYIRSKQYGDQVDTEWGKANSLEPFC